MKKLLSFVLLFLTAMVVQAQQRKTWDFSQGMSEETKENLNADTEYWEANRTDEVTGVVYGWKNKAKIDGVFIANGIPIPEFSGLTFGTTGTSGSTDYLIDASTFRMGRTKNELNLPRLAAGQTVTLRAKSANSDATDRGFVSGNNNLEYISGPEGGLCVGKNNDSYNADSDGFYTLVWRVVDDIDGDSADIQIITTAGGLDITLIQIDNGDASSGSSTDVAFIYDSSVNANLDEDIAYQLMPATQEKGINDLNVVPIDINGDVSEISRDSLVYYNVVIVSSAINPDNAFVATIKEAIARTPMLVFTPNLYKTWGYGEAIETNSNVIDVPSSYISHSLYTPYDDVSTPSWIDDNGQMVFLEEGYGNIIGYKVEDGSYFADDKVLGKVGDINAIHLHNSSRNAYLMLPYTYDCYAGESVEDIIPNAMVLLNKTKVAVSNAGKPTIKEDYHNLYTTVTIGGSTTNSVIYYTLDGSDPTTSSTAILYSGTFDVNQSGITVKAYATADGYDPSTVVEQEIAIYELCSAPSINFSQEGDTSIITITATNERDTILFYNFIGSSDSLESARYTEPVKVTKHVTVTAFAGEHDSYLQSDNASCDVSVANEKVRMDVVSHFDGKTDWSSLKITSYSYYTEEELSTDVFKDINGDDSVVINYKPAEIVTYCDPGNGWEFVTWGQGAQYQNNTIVHNVANFDAYNPQTPWDDSEYEATSGAVQFLTAGTNVDGVRDPSTASIQSTESFQGPFDVVVYAYGYNGRAKVYVTTDTLVADSWKELGDVNTGTIQGYATNGKDGSSRIWRKTILGYEESNEAFVKVLSGGNTVGIFDIYIKNAGEKSEAYLASIESIKDNSNVNDHGRIVSTKVYNVSGTLVSNKVRGINIIKQTYADGTVKTRKVIVK